MSVMLINIPAINESLQLAICGNFVMLESSIVTLFCTEAQCKISVQTISIDRSNRVAFKGSITRIVYLSIEIVCNALLRNALKFNAVINF